MADNAAINSESPAQIVDFAIRDAGRIHSKTGQARTNGGNISFPRNQEGLLAPWSQTSQRIFRFGAFEANLWTGELRKYGVKLRIQDQPMKVLAMLLDRPGELVTREQLREGLWSNDTFVDFDRGLNTAVNRLRTALNDSAENPRFVETVGGRGYRFIDALEKQESQQRSPKRLFSLAVVPMLVVLILALVWKWLPLVPGKASATNGRRAMAVIEVENLSQDPSLNWLGSGVVDLLTTDLGQSWSLDVISSERVRSLISREVKPGEILSASQAQRIAQKAGADMFVSGGLLKIGSGYKLNLLVQDTVSGKVLLADKIEGKSPEAIFLMVDQATEHIVSELAPRAGGTQSSPARLTSNLDALHAYEEGMSYEDRSLNDQATPSFRRAIELDPRFAMAYYQLSQFLPTYDEGRRALQRAAELAERQSLPEQQKLLIRAAQLRWEGRWEDAIEALRVIVRRFPKEIEPRHSLGNLLKLQGRFSESAAVLEAAAQLDDPKQTPIYNSLAYTYAYQGDVSKALGAVDKYATQLPLDDPNPIDTRADIYAMNRQFDKAITEYQRNAEFYPMFNMPTTKIALVYLLAGKNEKAEEAAQSAYRKARGIERAHAANVLGDIALGRGALNRAAKYFEESARLFESDSPYVASRELWKVGEIYFNQRKPQAALDRFRGTPGFGASEVRGIAYLISRNEPAAEREFAAARADMVAFFGDYTAEQLIDFDRLLAASHLGRWQQVTAGWGNLPGVLREPNAFFPGRAYAEMAMLPEAEKELRGALVWVSPGNLIGSYSDFFCYELTQFYLGNVLEREGKKVDAIRQYRAFLSHFEDSTARLPEISEARAAVHRLE